MLLTKRAANGGKARRGDIQEVVDFLNGGGYSYVTRRSIEWLYEKTKSGIDIHDSNVAITVVGGEPTKVEKDISDLTEAANNDNEGPVGNNDNEEPVDMNENDSSKNISKNTGGRTKGTTNEAKQDYLGRKKCVDICLQELC